MFVRSPAGMSIFALSAPLEQDLLHRDLLHERLEHRVRRLRNALHDLLLRRRRPRSSSRKSATVSSPPLNVASVPLSLRCLRRLLRRVLDRRGGVVLHLDVASSSRVCARYALSAMRCAACAYCASKSFLRVRVRQALNDVEAELRLDRLRDLARLERGRRVENGAIIAPFGKTPRLPLFCAAVGSVLYFFAMSAKFAGVTCARTSVGLLAQRILLGRGRPERPDSCSR